MPARRPRLVLILVVLLGGSACPPAHPDDDGGGEGECLHDEECPVGHICSSGTCVLGACDPQLEASCDDGSVAAADALYCCAASQFCDGATFACVNDPIADCAEPGTCPPTCVARIERINDVVVADDPSPRVQPLDDVVLTLADSLPATSDRQIVSFSWSSRARPADSTVRIANPAGVETSFTFADVAGVDLVGEYQACGEVVDDEGVASVNECCVTFDAIPGDDFLAQLSWDTDVNDLDLHVTKVKDGRACVENTAFGTAVAGLVTEACTDALDCNYATCRAERPAPDGPRPDWNGSATDDDADPRLDIDDVDGFGPEDISVATMTGGDYVVGVNAYSTSIAAGATVRLFIFGVLAGQFTMELTEPDWWEVALIHWPDDVSVAAPCVEDLTDGDATDDCGP